MGFQRWIGKNTINEYDNLVSVAAIRLPRCNQTGPYNLLISGVSRLTKGNGMRMLPAGLLIILASLTGCMSPEERAAHDAWEREQRDAYEIYQCQGLGFQQGTEAFGNCRLQLRAIDAQQQMAQAQYEAAQQQTVIVVDDDDHDRHNRHERDDDHRPPQSQPAPAPSSGGAPSIAGTLKFVPR